MLQSIIYFGYHRAGRNFQETCDIFSLKNDQKSWLKFGIDSCIYTVCIPLLLLYIWFRICERFVVNQDGWLVAWY